MHDPRETDSSGSRVSGQYGGDYTNTKLPDQTLGDGTMTDSIESGEPSVGPQGE